MKKVQGYDNLYRDETGAIINKDVSGYHRYINRKRKLEEKDNALVQMQTELESAKAEIQELKELVNQALGLKNDK